MQLVHILLVIAICILERLFALIGLSGLITGGSGITHPYCGYDKGRLIATKDLDGRRYVDYALYYPLANNDKDISPGMTLKSSKPGLFKIHIAKNTHMSRFELPINTMSWVGGFITLAINNMKYNIEHAVTSLEDPNIKLPILQIHVNPYYIKKRLTKDPSAKLSLGLRVRCKFNRNLLFFNVSPDPLACIYEKNIKPMILGHNKDISNMNDIIDYAKWYLFYKPDSIKDFLYHPYKYVVTPLTIRLGDDEIYSSYRYDGKQEKWITSELDAKDMGRPKTEEELRVLKQRGDEYEAYQLTVKEGKAKLYEDLPPRLRPYT